MILRSTESLDYQTGYDTLAPEDRLHNKTIFLKKEFIIKLFLTFGPNQRCVVLQRTNLYFLNIYYCIL